MGFLSISAEGQKQKLKLTLTLGAGRLGARFLNDATCKADNWRLNRDFANIFCSFKFSNDQILKISEILTKKRNYDFWKSIILIIDLMPDFSVFNFRANHNFIFEIRSVVLWKFQFYEIAEHLLRKHYFCDDSSQWRQH